MDKKNKIGFVLIFLYLGFIAGGSLTPIPPVKLEIPNLDKIIHVVLYIPLGFLLGLPTISSRVIFNTFIPLGVWIGICGIVELLQYFVPGRISSWGDEIATILGGGIGLGFGFMVKMIVIEKSSSEI